MKHFLGSHKKELLFVAVILAAAALIFAFTHQKGQGSMALLQYGDAAETQYIDLTRNAVYDIDTGRYTIHLQVQDGGIRFIDSPCPDHLCENFGTLHEVGDWAACMPAKASVTVVDGKP